jgi:hypothetical protein
MSGPFLNVFAVDSRFHDLIDKLVVTTDRFMTGRRTVSTTFAQLRAHMAKPRVAPVPLAWSAALRVCQDIIIQASIEYVTYLPALIPFTYFVPRVGRSRKYIHITDSSQY